MLAHFKPVIPEVGRNSITMYESIGHEKHSGVGEFISGNIRIEASFSILWSPQYSSVLVENLPKKDTLVPLLGSQLEWNLKGKLEDGRTVRARGMILEHASVGPSESYVEFFPLLGINIGIKKRLLPQTVKYKLIGFYAGEIGCRIDGWHIMIFKSAGMSPQIGRLAKKRRLPSEGMILELSHKSSNLFQYEEKYQAISKLLTLASGSGVTAHRHTVLWQSSKSYEFWRHRTGYEFGPGSVLPNDCYSQFLQQTLPNWESWSNEKLKVVKLAIDYINLSTSGYLDSRLFQVMQTWEFLANAWGESGELTPGTGDLRKEIKKTYRKWRKNHQKEDPDGLMGGRLMFAFQWQRVKKSIIELAFSRGLDLANLGIDLDRLKEARDSVAHTGKLPANLPQKDKLLDLLVRSQNALQLFLLTELGYQGRCYVRNLNNRSVTTSENIRV